MENIILEFKNVTGRNEGFNLEDVSLKLPAGFIMGLMGVNGAGKSTLISYIMDSEKHFDGQILVCGEEVSKKNFALKNMIGFVSEENEFFKERTGRQNVKILSGFYDEFDMEIFEKAMKDMGVSADTTYKKMSRGEKLKFQMAFAMAHKPKLYILDEVTAGMDPVFRIDFFKILGKVIEDGTVSVLMTSHIENEIEVKTDYVGILDEGRLIEFGESIDVIGALKGVR